MSAFGLIACLLACSSASEAEPDADTLVVNAPIREPAETAYDRAVHDLDEQIRTFTARADQYPTRMLPLRRLASAHMARARLTGNYDDFVAAVQSLDEAFEKGPDTGPFLTRASLRFTLHQLDAAEQDIDRAGEAIIVNLPQRSIHDGIKGDIAFHRGLYGAAEDLYARSWRTHPTRTTALRRAWLAWHLADFEEAERWLEEASTRIIGPDPQTRAFIALQRGLLEMDRGRHGEALRHFEDADGHFDGWWLVEEHEAEALVWLGRREDAEAIYRHLAEHGRPEHLAALGELVGGDEGQALFRRALEGHRARLELLPTAAGGHAIDFFLHFGDPAEALELAERDHALRPGGAATLKLVQALARNGEIGAASERMAALLRTPYRTAELLATAAWLARRNGDESADEHLRAAVAIHPRAVALVEWLN